MTQLKNSARDGEIAGRKAKLNFKFLDQGETLAYVSSMTEKEKELTLLWAKNMWQSFKAVQFGLIGNAYWMIWPEGGITLAGRA